MRILPFSFSSALIHEKATKAALHESSYAQSMISGIPNKIKFFVEYLKELNKGKEKILAVDVGCCVGKLGKEISKHLPVEIIGIDTDALMIRKAIRSNRRTEPLIVGYREGGFNAEYILHRPFVKELIPSPDPRKRRVALKDTYPQVFLNTNSTHFLNSTRFVVDAYILSSVLHELISYDKNDQYRADKVLKDLRKE